MAEETKTLEDLKDLVDPALAQAAADNQAPTEPQLDEHGRAYATGRRKDAVARVWIKPGRGVITVNGREFERYFAVRCCAWSSTSRSKLLPAKVSTTSTSPLRVADCPVRPARCATGFPVRCRSLSRNCAARLRKKAS